MAFAGQLCAWVQGGCVIGWEYISTGRWWATLMRHYLLACPPLPLAPGVGVAAFAAVLVALGSGALGATSGLLGAVLAAVALAAVAVAADEGRTSAQDAQKASGWRRRGLDGGHGRVFPCVSPGSGQPCPLREILTAATASPKRGSRGATVLHLQVTVTVAPASCTGRRYVPQDTSAAPYPWAGPPRHPTAKAGPSRALPCLTERAPQSDSKIVHRSPLNQQVNALGCSPTPDLRGN